MLDAEHTPRPREAGLHLVGDEHDAVAIADVAQRRQQFARGDVEARSEEHTSELQSLMRISYAVFCLKKKMNTTKPHCNMSEDIINHTLHKHHSKESHTHLLT